MRRFATHNRNQHLRRALAITSAVIFSASISPALAQAPVSSLSISKTEIVFFVPGLPTGDTREGSCGSKSIVALTRRDAYRCSVGDEIHDPCFRVPPIGDRLVCDANPALKTEGFVLKLIKPSLPGPSHVPRGRTPWILKLADGSICETVTGTLPSVNGQPARWTCAIHIRDQVRPAGVVTTLEPGKIWMADRYPESAIETPGQTSDKVEAEKVPVKMIWE